VKAGESTVHSQGVALALDPTLKERNVIARAVQAARRKDPKRHRQARAQRLRFDLFDE
jgi:hypothetical protein